MAATLRKGKEPMGMNALGTKGERDDKPAAARFMTTGPANEPGFSIRQCEALSITAGHPLGRSV